MKKQLPSLTSLKGLFIMLIVLHNTLTMNHLFESVPGMAFIRLFGGEFGDSIFFMLSGFLFSYSYRDRIASGTVQFQDFLGRRLSKLFPLYLITNAITMVQYWILYGVSALPLKKTAFTVLLQMGGGLEQGVPYNAPTWFLSALFVCYILFYAITYHSKKPIHHYCAICFLIIWGYYLSHSGLNFPFCFEGNGTAFLNFFIGCGLASLLPMIRANTHRWLQPACLLMIALSFFSFFRYGVTIISGGFADACAFVISPIVLYLAASDGLCSKILSFKPFVWLGNISLSIFFWHMVFYNMVIILIPENELTVVHYILFMVSLLLGSLFSYYVLEKKFLSFPRHTRT